jgi:hypothetical protein
MIKRVKSQVIILFSLALLCTVVSCWESGWTEEERIEFRKKCESQVLIEINSICLTGFQFSAVDTVMVVEKHGSNIIDSIYIYTSPNRDPSDEECNHYRVHPHAYFNINGSYEFYLGDSLPYVLHEMEIVMTPRYTMTEGWGCAVENFSIGEERFEDEVHRRITKREM